MDKQVLDIRSLEDLSEFPELQDIREAVINFYDNHLEYHRKSIEYILNKYSNKLPEDEIETLIWVEITRHQCKISSNALLNYLNTKFPGKYDLYTLRGYAPAYFSKHTIALIVSRKTGEIFALSPANMKNEDDLDIYPKFNRKIFQRLTNVIYGKEIEKVIETIFDIERGGRWSLEKWESKKDFTQIKTPELIL